MCGLGELFGARSTLEQVLGAYSSFLGIFLADCKDLVDFMFRSGTREITPGVRRENKEKKRREGVWRKVQKQGSLLEGAGWAPRLPRPRGSWTAWYVYAFTRRAWRTGAC